MTLGQFVYIANFSNNYETIKVGISFCPLFWSVLTNFNNLQLDPRWCVYCGNSR